MKMFKTILIVGLTALMSATTFARPPHGPGGLEPFMPYHHHHHGGHYYGGDWWIPLAVVGGVAAISSIAASNRPTYVAQPTTTVVVPQPSSTRRITKVEVMPDGTKIYYYAD